MDTKDILSILELMNSVNIVVEKRLSLVENLLDDINNRLKSIEEKEVEQNGNC